VLVVTTGSKAADLRRGSERLPGRKGRLDRTAYLFTPIAYVEFLRAAGESLGDRTLPAYLLSGGAPVACAEVAATGRLPEYVLATARDWVYGEAAAAGRSRASVLAVLQCLHRFGGTPVGQAKVAREAGLANNTVAAGYIELLSDLQCVGQALAWDPSRRIRLRRRPAKFPFINLLVAVASDPSSPRTPAEIEALPPEAQGRLREWLVAQELWRRAAIRGDETPEEMAYFQAGEHEIDFVVGRDEFVEVKGGGAGPSEFAWFARAFPRGRLTVISRQPFETRQIRGVTLESFLGE